MPPALTDIELLIMEMVGEREGRNVDRAVRQLLKVRKKVETVLTEQLAPTKIKTHDIWHFTSNCTAKILACDVCIMLKSCAIG